MGEGLQPTERSRRQNLRVFVLNKRGQPLMPCSPAKARILIKEHKAIVKRRTPFTIQLTTTTGETKQPITLGVDAGSKFIGISASTKRAELYASEVVIRNDITELLSTRKELRIARRGRKTRYRAPRFDNRVHSKHKGWLAPSTENKINVHISRIDFVKKILPVSKITVEIGSFDIQKIKNPDIEGVGYQQGDQLGFWNVREFVLSRNGHKCQYCKGMSKDPILNVHHLQSRKTGGDAPNNLITLCETCHKALHRGEIQLKQKRGKSFKDAAFMSIMKNTLISRLKEKYPESLIQITYGYITKSNRIKHNIKKSHHDDAFCIAGNFEAKRLNSYYLQKQTRKHNRQIHKMTINKGGIRKRNQAPYEIKGFRLFDKVRYKGQEAFIWGRRSAGNCILKLLTGEKIHNGIGFGKLKLLEKRKTFLTQLIKENAIPPATEVVGSIAEFQ